MLHKPQKPVVNNTNTLVQSAMEVPDQPLLICPPTKALIYRLLRLWLALFLLIFLSIDFLTIVTAPVLMMWLFHYAKLSVIWGIYRFSRAIYHISTILSFIVMVTITVHTRPLFLQIF